MFELNGSTLVGIGTVLGALAGAVSFLFKALITAKDEHIRELRQRIEAQAEDRDFWRDVAMGRANANDRIGWENERDRARERAERRAH